MGLRFAYARKRVVVAFAVGLMTFAALLSIAPWQVAMLAGWSLTAAVTVAWVFWAVWHQNPEGTAALASREDNSRVTADVLLVSSSVGSLVGVGFGLVKAAGDKGAAKAVLTGLAVLSVVLSWAVVQVVFMLRYARLWHVQGGGIHFGEDTPPDYHDFAYVAFTVGMTYQVSDTDLTTKAMRRTSLAHALLSYLFGTGVVAMTINLVAGLLR